MRQQGQGQIKSWLLRNQGRLFAVDIVCITLLFFTYLLTSAFQVLTDEEFTIVHVGASALAIFVILSIIWKGIVPSVIGGLGVVLIMTSSFSPSSSSLDTGDALRVAVARDFFLGMSMLVLGIIIAFRPTALYTRYRPKSLDKEWSDYPVWRDNALLADGRSDPSVPIKSMMTDVDRYMLWRYEYVLASVYGTLHLVKPEGLVPKDSTAILRDKLTGRIIGKPRYAGLFT